MTTALITGVTGQDGHYLAGLLLAEGWRVAGCARHAPAAPLPGGVTFHPCDVRHRPALAELLARTQPDEVYHLAADSSVERSWDDPAAAASAVVEGTATVLKALRDVAPRARLVLASSSEVFAGATTSPQDEATPFAPLSPYGRGKAMALELAREHREQGRHVSSAILYNHESPLRSPRFVSRKVTLAVAQVAAGRATELHLGNLEARRDWGFAGDYVDALRRMARAEVPGDYVIGTGASHSVAQLCATAFAAVGLDWRQFVRSDPALVRPVEPVALVANAARARERLGWVPRKAFAEMIGEMVAADVTRLNRSEG